MEHISIHRELARYYRLDHCREEAEKEYHSAINLLNMEDTNTKTNWDNYWEKVDIHIENNEYEQALVTIEQVLEQCSQKDFGNVSYIRNMGIFHFFKIAKHCEHVERFEKCIETYIDIY